MVSEGYAAMSLPGLNVAEAAEEIKPAKTATTHDIKAGTEWRFEVSFDSKIEVKVTHPFPLRVSTLSN